METYLRELIWFMVMWACPIGTSIDASRPGQDISQSASNQKLTDTPCSFPHMDYSHFTRFSIAILFRLCPFSLFHYLFDCSACPSMQA